MINIKQKKAIIKEKNKDKLKGNTALVEVKSGRQSVKAANFY